MRLSRPLDKILNNEIKVRALRAFCHSRFEVSGREIARVIGVTPKTAHAALQELLSEGILLLRKSGKTHLYRLNDGQGIVKNVLIPLFKAEEVVSEKLFTVIRDAIKHSKYKDDILSVVLFGSVHFKTDRPMSDIDLFVVVKNAGVKKKIESLFFDIDKTACAEWGNLISPLISSLSEFKTNARKTNGVVREILKSHQLICGARLERLLK